MTLMLLHVRDPVQPKELFWSSLTEEMIKRNPPRFTFSMGLTSAPPWVQDAPDPARLAMASLGGSRFE